MNTSTLRKPGIVIIGAGEAGLRAALTLRERRYEGALTVVGDEPHPPYERPPLSKGFLQVGPTTPSPVSGALELESKG